jgi:hypothetical protein
MGGDDPTELAPVDKGNPRDLRQPLKKACHNITVVRFCYRKLKVRTLPRFVLQQLDKSIEQPFRGANLFDRLHLTFHQF